MIHYFNLEWIPLHPRMGPQQLKDYYMTHFDTIFNIDSCNKFYLEKLFLIIDNYENI